MTRIILLDEARRGHRRIQLVLGHLISCSSAARVLMTDLLSAADTTEQSGRISAVLDELALQA